MFDAFEEVFAPGRKHTRDEQKRLELTREDVGDNDPGRGPIDLASGKALIRLPPQPPPPAPAEPKPAGTEPAGTEPAGTEPGGTEPAGTAPAGKGAAGTAPAGKELPGRRRTGEGP
ncbi:DUF6191 domain-containing protein [Streptomyces capoamus]|uniref:DUF6191 domain-containing protein n=1 Tax=Streptomyces capoamus TaxID=68183 RepID=UPI003398F651